MLTELRLSHFKCFEELRLPIAPLTLLAGANASGKSSVLQGLTLLHQTMREQEWATRLMLNGSALRLGTVADVVDKVHGRRTFELGLVDAALSYSWTFGGEREEMSMAVERVSVGDFSTSLPDRLRHLLPPDIEERDRSLSDRLCRATYITAERIGPREVYELEDPQVEPVVGARGERAVSVLYWGRTDPVIDSLALPDFPPTRQGQVQARMAQFFPGTLLDMTPVPHTDSVTLGIRTSEDTDFHRPIHVGFGLTQILPIVIAALAAREGDILLIENPEVHLHPAGQALMGRFLAEVAASNVQVLLETHSDHVLNGIRRHVRSAGISAEGVAIHFFRARTKEDTQVVSPVIDAVGNLDSWPDGFFDQFDKDTSVLAGWEG